MARVSNSAGRLAEADALLGDLNGLEQFAFGCDHADFILFRHHRIPVDGLRDHNRCDAAGQRNFWRSVQYNLLETTDKHDHSYDHSATTS